MTCMVAVSSRPKKGTGPSFKFLGAKQRWASTVANRSNAQHRSNTRAPPAPPRCMYPKCENLCGQGIGQKAESRHFAHLWCQNNDFISQKVCFSRLMRVYVGCSRRVPVLSPDFLASYWSAGFGTFLQISTLASHWLESVKIVGTPTPENKYRDNHP